MKQQFIPSLHAFRGFAILNIVAVHAYSFFSYDARQLEPFNTGAHSIYYANEALFHGSTLYFALISGLLFSTVLASRSWQHFFKSKLLNVLLPYCVLNGVFTFVIFKAGERNLFSGSPLDYASSFAENLISGGAIFPYWYMPVLFVLFVSTPILFYLSKQNWGRWILFLLFLSPLIAMRTWPEKTVNNYVYFLGAYALGLYLGLHYRRTLEIIERYKAAILTTALASSIALFTFYWLEFTKWENLNFTESIFYPQKLAIAAIVLLLFEKTLTTVPRFLDILGNYAFAIFFLHGFILYELYIDTQHFSPLIDSAFEIFLAGSVAFILSILLSLAIAFIVKMLTRRYSRWLIGA